MTPDLVLQAVPVHLGNSIEVGNVTPLFKLPVNLQGVQYAAANDGQEFLVNERTGEPRSPEFSVVVNWTAEWKP